MRWSGLLPSALIVLALVSLLLVPVGANREVRETQDEIERAADPARTLVTEVQYLLARRTSTLRGYFITRDSSFLLQYRNLAAEQARVQEELEPLVRRLGSDAVAHFAEFRTLSDRWYREVEEDLRAGEVLAPGRVPFEWELYLETLEVARRLDEALAAATAERHARVEAAERRVLWIQGALGMLALAAAFATGWLSWRVHRLAAEAEARHGQAEHALAETARAVESKARLIRGVTHDVKNPLGAADGYAELLEMGLHGPLAPPQTAVVAGIRRSIRGALEIIQDLLDLSHAEAGDLPVDPSPTCLGALVADLVDDYRGSAHARGHSLEVEIPPEPPVALTDGARVRQILGNLLGNAIKYTPRGGRIRVSVAEETVDSGPDAGRWATVRVTDSGPGIRAADRERIFEEFERLPGSSAPGHGLGLTISRRIARLLGGDITVEGDGRGSTFVLRLPLAHAPDG